MSRDTLPGGLSRRCRVTNDLAKANGGGLIDGIERQPVQFDPRMAVETRPPRRDHRNTADEARLVALPTKERVRRKRATDTGSIIQAEASGYGNRHAARFTPPTPGRSAGRAGVDGGEEFAKILVMTQGPTDGQRHPERSGKHAPVIEHSSPLAHCG